MDSFIFPAFYSRIKVVKSFDELVSTPFMNGINAMCWQRQLPGDFNEVVNAVGTRGGMITLDKSRLENLSLSDGGGIARDILLEDLGYLQASGLSPSLDCIHEYPRDDDSQFLSTDVYSFHVDSATVCADTYLCTYLGMSSQGLRNDQAQRHVDIPHTRTKLLKLFGGEDNEEFEGFLNENHYDLHYAPIEGAQPFSFGLGNLWRIAVEYPGSPVPPCIHRAPSHRSGNSPRLLLIS